jgi:hypothetical protein
VLCPIKVPIPQPVTELPVIATGNPFTNSITEPDITVLVPQGNITIEPTCPTGAPLSRNCGVPDNSTPVAGKGPGGVGTHKHVPGTIEPTIPKFILNSY